MYYIAKMREQFIAKIWIVGGAFVVNIPKKLINLFKIKKVIIKKKMIQNY